ncbi:amidase [Ideonella sp. 4Y11]|uniref:Amidase n=1 Tax=Ideonella aquatica TaxID=2824119 RepID=A0A940YH20_9BURK|nr:amidase [Ideonella aquatica]MBQ0959975.1 amidase [Ideonella aquatica]
MPPDQRESALHAIPAAELAPLYRRRQLSPVEVTQAVLERIDTCDRRVAATWGLDPESALAQARASEARWARRAALGPLDGVPVTLKENIASRGVPQPLGCAASLLTPAREDAPPTARLREAGAVFVARTTMPDWGMLSSGLSSFHRLTRNPWDLRRNPGGSSAGAGAAAAMGYGPIHLGTDIGGSIRLPAGWCGVVGFKPSLGRIPIKPPYIGRVAGPLTRTVTDCALAMSVLSRPDWRDASSLPPADIDWLDLQRPLKGLRLGVLLDAGWGDPLQPEVRDAVMLAALMLAAEGAELVELKPISTRAMVDGLDRFWRMRSWLDYAALPPERQAKVLPYIRRWIERGAQMSGEEVFRGFSQIAALRDAAIAGTHAVDYVLSPVSPDVAFGAAQASPLNDPERPFEHIAYTLPYNMSEQPAISVPAGHDRRGLPIGLQIAGRRHDDIGVLRLARAWEQLRPALRDWPEP